MSEKRLMLLGAGGQVGQALRAETLPESWRLGVYNHADLDITKHHKVQLAIRDFKPDLLINAAALTSVDEAEKNHDQAMAINFSAVANIAAQASAMDIPVIHLSTDYVFDGMDGEVPYKPHDPMHPLNVYGASKMMGEEALRQHHPWSVILRISSVFSAYGRNLLTVMLDLIDERDEINAFTDMTTGPTSAPEVARAMIAISQALFKGKHDGFGIFHLCGTPAASRYEFTEAVLEAYKPFTERRPKLIASLSKDFANRAPRPAWTVFDCEKIRSVYGIEQIPWRDSLKEAMETLMTDRRKIA